MLGNEKIDQVDSYTFVSKYGGCNEDVKVTCYSYYNLFLISNETGFLYPLGDNQLSLSEINGIYTGIL